MNVKIGMNMLLWGTRIGRQHIPQFEALKAAGFDGVEIPVAGQGDAEIRAMAAACDALGLERTASAFVGLDTNPISPEPAVRAAAVDNLKRSIDEAVLLGAQRLIGGMYQAHKYFTGQGPTHDEWQWSADCLRQAGEHAADAGLQLGLEVLNRFEVFLVNTAADCARLVADIGLDNVGVHYDTHHANIEDVAPMQALGGVSEVLNHVHLSESHRGTLGTGQVDWEANFAALKAIDYQGWLVIEAFGTGDPDLAAAANVWREAFSSREEVYVEGIEFIRSRL
jgi:D-psicose/D-tagatose/L-ribulose 3-epimerase